MNLYVSRSGQTFGPYTMEQAKTFLDSNQLLATDYALIEGTTDWKLLPELLSNYSAQTKDVDGAVAIFTKDDVDPSTFNKDSEPEARSENKKSVKKPKKSGPKVQKISKAKGGTVIMVAQEKSFVSKIFSTIFVFIFLILLKQLHRVLDYPLTDGAFGVGPKELRVVVAL